jgi:hypothetical protein
MNDEIITYSSWDEMPVDESKINSYAKAGKNYKMRLELDIEVPAAGKFLTDIDNSIEKLKRKIVEAAYSGHSNAIGLQRYTVNNVSILAIDDKPEVICCNFKVKVVAVNYLNEDGNEVAAKLTEPIMLQILAQDTRVGSCPDLYDTISDCLEDATSSYEFSGKVVTWVDYEILEEF